MTTKIVTHTSLVKLGTINLSQPTGESDIIDFREMNSGTIQIVVDGADVNDGVFTLKQSILCEPTSFAMYPKGTLPMDASCPNLAANICCIPFRYMKVCYSQGTDSTGTATIYARAKL